MISDIFLNVGEVTLSVLRDHVEGKKTENDWKMAAHKLKGSAAQIGANRLAAACLKAESSYSASQNEKMLLLAEVQIGFESVRVFFRGRQI